MKKIHYLLFSATLMIGSAAQAQLQIEIAGVGSNQIPVAVAAFADEGLAPSQISAIVRADLERSGVFKVIDAGYQAAIAAKVKSNTVYAGDADLPGNPKAVFKVDQLPTGEILSVRLTKSSGVPQFDEAVERGINKSSPLPKKKDGTVERTIVVNFSMKDLD